MRKYGLKLISDASESIKHLDNQIKSFSKNLSVNKNTSNVHIIEELTPVSDQKSLGSCVAQGTADAFEMLLGLQEKTVQQLSRLFIYWNARLYEGLTKEDSGTMISLAMQSLVDYGVCLESTWWYDEDKVFTQPNQLAYKQADDNRLNTFYKIRSSGDELLAEVEAAIRANHPVVFGTAVGIEFEDYLGEDGVVFNYPSKPLGNHCMIIVGVDSINNKFLIRNSWGYGWGKEGHAWFSGDYIKQSSELYVPTQMPDLLL